MKFLLILPLLCYSVVGFAQKKFHVTKYYTTVFDKPSEITECDFWITINDSVVDFFGEDNNEFKILSITEEKSNNKKKTIYHCIETEYDPITNSEIDEFNLCINEYMGSTTTIIFEYAIQNLVYIIENQ